MFVRDFTALENGMSIAMCQVTIKSDASTLRSVSYDSRINPQHSSLCTIRNDSLRVRSFESHFTILERSRVTILAGETLHDFAEFFHGIDALLEVRLFLSGELQLDDFFNAIRAENDRHTDVISTDVVFFLAICSDRN